MGIKEGRDFLKSFPDISLEEMQSCEQIAAINMKSNANEMRDCFKGERDFWRNQIKKKQA